MLSMFKLLVIAVIVFAVFGAGKLPKVMGDLGRGIRALKDGINGGDEVVADTTTPRVEPSRLADASVEVAPATVRDPEHRA